MLENFPQPLASFQQRSSPDGQILRISRIADLSKQGTATNISIRTGLNQPQFKYKCIMKDDVVAGGLDSPIYNPKSLPLKCVAR